MWLIISSKLLVQLQNKDQIISNLTAENDDLTSALNAAEQRVNQLYTEQSRSEVELAQRIDISDKLRTQVRELEKEKRDIQRRYNEQASILYNGLGKRGLTVL
jgi:predicted nuclease with TOPRIM domain